MGWGTFVWRHCVCAVAVQLLCATFSLAANPENHPDNLFAPKFVGGVLVSTGRFLDRDNPRSSFSLDPNLQYRFTENETLEILATLQRPFNGAEPWAVPKVTGAIHQKLAFWIFQGRWSLWGTAIDLPKWELDGAMARTLLTFEIERQWFPQFRTIARFGPFYQWNYYRTRSDGRSNPEWGFTEKLVLLYEPSPLFLEFQLLIEMSRAAVWRNDYGTVERIGYAASPTLRLGLSHQYLSELVDTSTGLYQAIGAFDGRKSHVSAFVEAVF